MVADGDGGPPGTVVSLPDGGLGVSAGEGVLLLSRLHLEGRRAVDAREFLRGHPDFVGARLG